MEHLEGEDLGYGVRAAPSANAEVVVVSRSVDLGWHPRAGSTPGTAVLWREEPFEVVALERGHAGFRWTLRQWDETEVMRTVFTLDLSGVAALAEAVHSERSGHRARMLTLPLLPILGLAPARLQTLWRNRWAFPASTATWLSALAEFILGSLGTMQLVFLVFDGEPFLPSWLAWLQYAGPPLVVFGIVRMAQVAANGEPVGSPLGLPLAILEKQDTPSTERLRPEVRQCDEIAGVLVLASPVHRADWDRDGVLLFRGQRFRLDATRHEGTTWVYVFSSKTIQGDDDRELRFLPPRELPVEGLSSATPSPSIVGTALVTACITLAPREDQQRWAKHTGIRPIWFTLVGAGAELIGGFVNLTGDSERGLSILVILDLFVFVEGLFRLTGVVLSGRPVGSVFGWFLRPLYRSRLPADETPHS